MVQLVVSCMLCIIPLQSLDVHCARSLTVLAREIGWRR